MDKVKKIMSEIKDPVLDDPALSHLNVIIIPLRHRKHWKEGDDDSVRTMDETVFNIFLHDEFKRPYMKDLSFYVKERKAAGKTITPDPTELISKLRNTPASKLRYLVLGDDPPNIAGALCADLRLKVDGVDERLLSRLWKIFWLRLIKFLKSNNFKTYIIRMPQSNKEKVHEPEYSATKPARPVKPYVPPPIVTGKKGKKSKKDDGATATSRPVRWPRWLRWRQEDDDKGYDD